MLDGIIAEIKEFLETRYFGKYRGIVDEVDEATGYIKAKVSKVWGDKVGKRWITPCVPFAGSKDGNHYGLVTLPVKGDGVWIEFEAGDEDSPIWTGFWWGKDEMPTQTKQQIRGLVTPEQLQFLMDDEAKEIKLIHPDGPEMKLTGSEIELKVGSKKIKLSSSGLDVNDGAFKVS